MTLPDALPEGFEALSNNALFTMRNGPVYFRTDARAGPVHILGLRIADIHCNTMGFFHGGMTATFADSSMAFAISNGLGKGCVTLKMAVEYLDAMHVGDWIESYAQIDTHDEQFAHASVELRVKERTRARASGVFALRRAKNQQKV